FIDEPQKCIPFIALDLDLKAYRLKVSLNCCAHGNRIEHSRTTFSNIEGHFWMLHPRFDKKLPGSVWIVWIRFNRALHPGESRRNWPSSNGCRVLQHILD